MSALDDLIAEVESGLEATSEALLDLGDPSRLAGHAEFQWISRQLETFRRFLEALLADLQAGMSPSELGFDSINELLETVQDIARQISLLKSRLLARQLALCR